MYDFFRKHKRWIIPLLAAVVFTPFSVSIDLSITNFFYEQAHENAFSSSPFHNFIFAYATWPALILFGASIIVFLLSFVNKKALFYKEAALVLMLTMIVGAGLFSHAVFKENWGRPRPKQVDLYGGSLPFQPFYKPNFNPQEPSKSFVCGHCTMGFYFLALILIGERYKNKRVALLGWVLTLLLGGLLSYTRLKQGGHFLSDVIFASLIMWWTALTADWLVWAEKTNECKST